MSTCGLVSAGILRRSGFKLPWNGCNYWEYPVPFAKLDIVSALSRLGQITESIRPSGQSPFPGDVRCIGNGLSTHVFTIVDVLPDKIVSVDGGAIDDAAHGYLQRVRKTNRPNPQSRVVWTIDSVALFAALEAAEAYP